MMIEWYPKTMDVAILWKHWSFAEPIKQAPRVFIGGRYKQIKIITPQYNIYYIWLD
jgi:hypothetical protein